MSDYWGVRIAEAIKALAEQVKRIADAITQEPKDSIDAPDD